MQLGPIAILAVLGAPPTHGEVAHRRVAGIEMAVIHQIAGRIDRSRLDLEPLSLFAFAPHHRESLALRHRHDGARTVTVERAAASRRKLLNVTPVGSAGEAEAHDLHPLAFHRIVIENESIDVRHQITFPRAHRQAFIFLKEFPLWTETVAELKGIAEDELIIVKKVDHMWRVGTRKKAHRLVRDIEMLIRNVKRECEDRAGAPFEGLF